MIQKITNPSLQKSNASSAAQSDTPRLDFQARFVNSIDELESLYDSWQRLIDVSVHKNLMFDPDFLIPAYKHLADKTVSILVIDAPQKSSPKHNRVLCGMVPLQQKRQYGMPLRALETWRHEQCFDCTPLLRADCAREVLHFLFDYLAETERTSLLGLDVVSNEGRFAEILTDVLYERKIKPFQRDSFTRACFRPEADSETYFAKHVSNGVQRTQRRLTRRLEEMGDVSVSVYRDPQSCESMIENFLRLEASGWKAESGTAINCKPHTQQFFHEMVTRSMKRNKLSFLAVKLDGRPISMLCDLYTGATGYSFKTTFDDELKEFSPGTMAEFRNIEFLHEADVQSVDSCTAPDNQTINRIWGGRIRFQNMIIPLGGKVSRFATAAMPLLQQLKHFRS